jgi:hypothetical protein
MVNETNPARELALKRKRQVSLCAECGKEMFGYINKVYCGPACRNRASRRRRKEQRSNAMERT